MFSTWVMLLTSLISWILPWWSQIVVYIMEEVKHLTDLKNSQSQWKGSQWILDASHPTARLGCILHTLSCQAGIRIMVRSALCAAPGAQPSSAVHAADQRSNCEELLCSLRLQPELHQTQPCSAGAGWRSVHRQEADGMPEFVSQMQQSTMGSSKEDTKFFQAG